MLSHPEFTEVVERSWKEGIEGWGCYVFKEKLKRLKGALRSWNVEQIGIIDQTISALRSEIQTLDLIDDAFGLSEEEVCSRNEASAKLLRQLHIRKSLLAQKSKLKWLKEGDVNSKLFHRAFNSRRKNGLGGLEVVDDRVRVKDFISEHFRLHFQKKRGAMVQLDRNIETSTLGEEDRDILTRSFLEKEVQQAVMECEGSRSPGPDGFNLIFYKICWNIIKEDLMRVLLEFHDNGRLSKVAIHLSSC